MPGGTLRTPDLHARTHKLHVRQCAWKGPEMAPAHLLLGERRRIGAASQERRPRGERCRSAAPIRKFRLDQSATAVGPLSPHLRFNGVKGYRRQAELCLATY